MSATAVLENGSRTVALRRLPDNLGGLLCVGTLMFVGPTARNPRMGAVDVTGTDGDGRPVVLSSTFFISQERDGKVSLTEMGQAMAEGRLHGLVGSEVAVSVSQRVSSGNLYMSCEAIHPLSRS